MLDFEPSAATGPEYAMTRKSSMLDLKPSATTGPEYAVTRKSSMLDFWPGVMTKPEAEPVPVALKALQTRK